MNSFNFIEYYNNVFILVFVVYTAANTFLIGWLANKKGYSVSSWMILGFLFGVFALITLGFAPNQKTEDFLQEIFKLLKTENKENINASTKTNNSGSVNQNISYKTNDNDFIKQKDCPKENKKYSENDERNKPYHIFLSDKQSKENNLTLKEEVLLSYYQFNDLEEEKQTKYVDSIKNKINLEIDTNKKKEYYKYLDYLGYRYYRRFL